MKSIIKFFNVFAVGIENIKIVIFLLIPIAYSAQSKTEVRDFIKQVGIKHSRVATAQCYYESAHLTSDVFKNNNNLFGMKLAKQRYTLAIGKDENDHAIYKDWRDSVLDYLLWQSYYYKGGDYYNFIKKSGYCPYNENYITTLKMIRV